MTLEELKKERYFYVTVLDSIEEKEGGAKEGNCNKLRE